MSRVKRQRDWGAESPTSDRYTEFIKNEFLYYTVDLALYEKRARSDLPVRPVK